jgi:hypothetical protein
VLFERRLAAEPEDGWRAAPLVEDAELDAGVLLLAVLVGEEPVLVDEEPVLVDEEPVLVDEEPVLVDEEPVLVDEEETWVLVPVPVDPPDELTSEPDVEIEPALARADSMLFPSRSRSMRMRPATSSPRLPVGW